MFKTKMRKMKYHKVTTEIMSAGIWEDDPSVDLVQKTYYWCLLREKELHARGWTWEAKNWGGYASCNLDDTRDAEALLSAHKSKNQPPLFSTLDDDSKEEQEDTDSNKEGDEED